MVKGLAQTVCRLFAAFVCLLCASEVFGFSPSTPPARSESQLSPAVFWSCSRAEPRASTDDDFLATSGSPDSREEREERDDADDEDDDLDDSHHVPWSAFPAPPRLLVKARFPAARTPCALRPGHHSLDPKPPRRA
jgi:hypothetical protein